MSKVRMYARCFENSAQLVGAKVTVFKTTNKNGNRFEHIPTDVTAITDKNGECEFELPIDAEVSLRLELKDFQTTQTGLFTVPANGIDLQPYVRNVPLQVPSSLAVAAFAYAMNTHLPKDWKAQCIVATIADSPDRTQDDLPQGLVGAQAEVEFLNPEIQKAWQEKIKQDANNKQYNDNLKNAATFASIVTAIALYQFTDNIHKSALAAVAAKIVFGTLAWKYFAKVIRTAYSGVCTWGYFTNKTNPFDIEPTRTTADGGVLFITRDINFPAEGAKFIMKVKGPDELKVSTGFGVAYNNVLTNFTPPFSPAAESLPNDAVRAKYGHRTMYECADESERPSMAAKSVGLGLASAVGLFKATLNSSVAIVAGTALTGLAWNVLNRRAISLKRDELLVGVKKAF